MTEVNTSDLKRNFAMSDMKEDVREKQMKTNVKKSMMPKKTGLVFMNKRHPHPQIPQLNMQQFKEIQQKDENNNKEMRIDLKNLLFSVASKPIALSKQESLKKNLNDSVFLNSYVDNNMYINLASKINDNLKAGLCYASIYCKTLNEN